jgi:hypothetical protein
MELFGHAENGAMPFAARTGSADRAGLAKKHPTPQFRAIFPPRAKKLAAAGDRALAGGEGGERNAGGAGDAGRRARRQASCGTHHAPSTMRQASRAKHQASCANHHASYLMHHAPSIIRQASCAMRHAPSTTRHASCAKHQASCAKHNTPCIMRHASRAKHGRARQPRGFARRREKKRGTAVCPAMPRQPPLTNIIGCAANRKTYPIGYFFGGAGFRGRSLRKKAAFKAGAAHEAHILCDSPRRLAAHLPRRAIKCGGLG